MVNRTQCRSPESQPRKRKSPTQVSPCTWKGRRRAEGACCLLMDRPSCSVASGTTLSPERRRSLVFQEIPASRSWQHPLTWLDKPDSFLRGVTFFPPRFYQSHKFERGGMGKWKLELLNFFLGSNRWVKMCVWNVLGLLNCLPYPRGSRCSRMFSFPSNMYL